MKLNLVFLIITVGLTTNAQNVTIKGFAVDSTQGRNTLHVTINDTLKKFEKLDGKSYPKGTWHKIKQAYSVRTEPKTGYFSINADLSDSLTFSSSFSFEKYIPQTYAIKDLYKLDKVYIELKPVKCIEYEECLEKPEVFAFVGEVLEVKQVEEIYYCNYLTLDLKYKAKLKILDQVYNNYKQDTITFFAYDHYGKPAFSEYKNVLIYVIENCNVNYHPKYLFSPTYKVGKSWKVPYSKSKTKDSSLLHKLAKPVNFDDDLYYNFRERLTEEELNQRFPQPYFSIKDNLVRPLYGYDVKDVFQIMKQTHLKEYGPFQEN